MVTRTGEHAWTTHIWSTLATVLLRFFLESPCLKITNRCPEASNKVRCRAMSRRKLMRHTLTIVQAQIDLAAGARAALDALEQARATIEQQRGGKVL